MNWQYTTILFEFQKDGLLGERYIDDDEMEKVLNEQGGKGWELVSVTPVQEGLLSFFKRPLQIRKQMVAKKTESQGSQPRSAHPREKDPAAAHRFPKGETTASFREGKAEEAEQNPNGIGEIKIS